MASGIKKALIRTRLRAQGKRELRRLPLDEWAEPSLDAWLSRFWSLSPNQWAQAVDLRIEEAELRAATPKQSFNWEDAPFPIEVDESLKDSEATSEKWADYEERYRAFWSSQTARAAKTDDDEEALLQREVVKALTPGQVTHFEALSRLIQETALPIIETPLFDVSKEFGRAREAVERLTHTANNPDPTPLRGLERLDRQPPRRRTATRNRCLRRLGRNDPFAAGPQVCPRRMGYLGRHIEPGGTKSS